MRFPKKSLGQNFLIDKNIIKKIIKLACLKNRNIVEIGPGKGALTSQILNEKPKMSTRECCVFSQTSSSKFMFVNVFHLKITLFRPQRGRATSF